MDNPQLLEYIRKQLAAGTPREDIVQKLLANRWKIADVDHAFSTITTESAAPGPASVSPFVQIDTGIDEKDSSRRTRLVVGILAGVVLVGGGIAFAYFTYFTTPSPTAILQRALQNTLTAKTLVFSATSTGSFAEPGAGMMLDGMGSSTLSATFTDTMNGAMDVSSPIHPSFDMQFALSATLAIATSTDSATMSAHMIYAHYILYSNLSKFNLNSTAPDSKLAAVPFGGSVVNSLAAALENTWVAWSATSTPLVASSSPALQADLTALHDYLSGLTYVTSLQNVGTENTDGVATYHLQASVQGEQALVDIVQRIIADVQLPSAPPLSTEQKKNLSQALTQGINMDLWIGTGDSRIYRIVTSSPIVFVNTETSATSTITSQEISFSNYNQPVVIVTPQNAKPLEQVMQGIVSGLATQKPATK